MTTLVRGLSVLTGRLDVPAIDAGGLVVEDGRILAIGPAEQLRRAHRPDREIGGPDVIVLPGLASAHLHAAGVGSVQMGCPDQHFERWMISVLGQPVLDPYLDTVYQAMRLIENGVTTVLHSHYTRDLRRYADEVDDHLRAWHDSGIRVGFAPCLLDNNLFVYPDNEGFLTSLPPELAARAREFVDLSIPVDAYIELISRLRARFVDSDRVRILLGPVAPQWCRTDTWERLAASTGPLGIHTHLLESPAQRRHLDRWLGRSVVTWLDELGFLVPESSFAHGVWLTEPEIELLAQRGCRIVHNPASNLRLGNGIAPVRELRAAGVQVALGTDDMTLHDDNDLLSEARLAGLLGRVRGHHLDGAELLHMASAVGATAAGFGGITGILTPGARADLVLLDARRLMSPAVTPDVSPLDLVLARGLGSDVRTVLIDGEVVYDNGQHRWVDRAAVLDELGAMVRARVADPAHRARAQQIALLAEALDRSRQAEVADPPDLMSISPRR